MEHIKVYDGRTGEPGHPALGITEVRSRISKHRGQHRVGQRLLELVDIVFDKRWRITRGGKRVRGTTAYVEAT